MEKNTNLKKLLLCISMVLVISGTKTFVTGQAPVTPSSYTECETTHPLTLTYSVRLLKGNSYQWYTAPYRSKEFIAIPGATSNVLTLTFGKGEFLGPLTREYNGTQFKCLITPVLGLPAYSEIAYLYVHYGPSISGHPSSATKFEGESVTFSVTASGSTPRYYQWRVDKSGGYSDILGATSSSFTIDQVTLGDIGNYICVVTNECGSATSNIASLMVNKLDWPQAWFSQKENTYPENAKFMYDVHAVDKYKAWIVVTEYYDSLLHTVDGGENWIWSHTGVTNKTYWRTIFFTDANHGWVGGYNVIAYTIDGGTSWQQWYNSGANYIEDLFFINSTTGWAVGYNGKIYKTTDGGVNWNQQASGKTANFNQVHFADANNGIAVGQSGTIVYTRDGGDNWLTPVTNPAEVTLNAVYMTHSDTAYIAGSYQANQPYPYYYMHMKTTDGGANWEKINGPSNYGNDLKFVNSKEGWMIGGSGKIYYTNNSGANWYEQSTETTQTLYAISMVDSDNGWAVGYAGAMQRTAFGGCNLPRVNLYADTTICASSGFYTLHGNTYGVSYHQTYLWNTGDTTEYIYSVPPGGKYWVDVWSMCGDKATDTVTVGFYPFPVVDAGEPDSICPGDTIQLIASGGVDYSWTPYNSLNNGNIQNPRAFPLVTTTYTVTVADTNNCISTDYVEIYVNYPYNEEICLISVDPDTEKNMVIWERHQNRGTVAYNIYREGDIINDYEFLATIPFDDLSVYVDMTSQPKQQSNRYKISSINTCSDTSLMSGYHKSIHLQYGSIDLEGVNMNWNKYEIEGGEIDFISYIIYRGSDSTQLQPIDTVPASLDQYTDTDPDAVAGKRYYRIAGVKSVECAPANLIDKKAGTGPYSHSMSNIEDNRLQVGINDMLENTNNLWIYPNPFRQQTKITYTLNKPSDVRIEVYNLLGARTADIVNMKQDTGEFTYDINADELGVSEGVFYLRFTVNGNTTVKKLILTK